jgi:hypothetical protein
VVAPLTEELHADFASRRMYAFLFCLCLAVVVVVGELTDAYFAKIGSLLDKSDERSPQNSKPKSVTSKPTSRMHFPILTSSTAIN